MNDTQRALYEALTPLQQKVSINSIAGMSNIDSYINGGGKSKNKQSAEAAASRTLSDERVKAFVDSMVEVAISEAVMSRQEMMEKLSIFGRVGMNDLIEWATTEETNEEGENVIQSAWRVKDSAMNSSDVMSTISEVSSGKDGIKIKQHSPMAAMKQLADLAGYNEAIKVDNTHKVMDSGDNQW